MNGYFKKSQHEINIEGNGSCVVLPKMRTETGKEWFANQGAHIFRFEKATHDEISILLFKKKQNHRSLCKCPKKRLRLQ